MLSEFTNPIPGLFQADLSPFKPRPLEIQYERNFRNRFSKGGNDRMLLILYFNDILIWQPCHRWLSVACRSFCFGCWRRSAGARARLGSVSHHCPSVPSEMPLPRKIKSGIRTPHLQCGHWSTSRQIGNSAIRFKYRPLPYWVKLKNMKRPLHAGQRTVVA